MQQTMRKTLSPAPPSVSNVSISMHRPARQSLKGRRRSMKKHWQPKSPANRTPSFLPPSPPRPRPVAVESLPPPPPPPPTPLPLFRQVSIASTSKPSSNASGKPSGSPKPPQMNALSNLSSSLARPPPAEGVKGRAGRRKGRRMEGFHRRSWSGPCCIRKKLKLRWLV